MRESTEQRVDELVELSRLAVKEKFGGEPDAGLAFAPLVDRVCEQLVGLTRAERVAVCVCALEVQLEMYADEVDRGIPGATSGV